MISHKPQLIWGTVTRDAELPLTDSDSDGPGPGHVTACKIELRCMQAQS
jgi:hypothetical protein